MAIALSTDIVKDDVLAIDATFGTLVSTIPDTTWFTILAYVNGLLDTDIDPGGGLGGPTVRFARLLLAAHFALCIKRGSGGAAGPVTGETAGGLRRTFAAFMFKGGISGLNATMYGQQYQVIVATSPAHGPFLI